MTTQLLDWIEAPSEDRGIHFALDGDDWRFSSYVELAAQVRFVANRLLESGVAPGSVVATVVPSGPLFVASFFGALVAGATPCPIVPPAPFERRDDFVEHAARLIRLSGSVVVTSGDLRAIIGDVCAMAGSSPPIVLPAEGAATQVDRQPVPDPALLQFTSGSTGDPKGVRVTSSNLDAMIAGIFEWVPWQEQDAGAHWLPLYHDFGLIGCLLAPVSRQRGLWILRPEDFLLKPERWLECFGLGRAAFGAAPTFAFSYALRKISPRAFLGHDYSGWKGAILGAERLDADVITAFARLLAPVGLRRETFMPAYGLAEATLGVTGVPLDRVAKAVLPDWDRLRFGASVKVRNEEELGSLAIANDAGWLLSCGYPLRGATVEIIDEDENLLEPGSLGEIRVRGPTVADGYIADARDERMTAFTGAGLRTGDAGFIRDDELFVLGRIGDSVKVRGKPVYVEDLENRLTSLEGVPPGRCVVLPELGRDRAALAVVIETRDAQAPWAERVVRAVESSLGAEAKVSVFLAYPGTLPRTSSGKPRRRLLAEELAQKGLEDARFRRVR